MRRVLVAAFVVAALSGSALAAEKSVESSLRGTKGRYGDAGCGLGSLAFGDQQGAIQILAATLNGTGIQTFGITTGTSNCSGISGGQATRIFIEANREALAKDVSRGSGETIGTLTWLNGCADSKAVGATLQKNFSVIFPSENVSTDAVTEAVIKTLKDEKMLACQNLG
jgi:DUF3015 family protein